jgi:predicted  nucleic acid-binding Zn-ribbon protein
MRKLSDSLSTLHRILRQVADLRDRLQRGPKQIRVAEGTVSNAEVAVAQAKDNYKQAKMAADEKQLQLRQRESRINDLQGKLNTANNNKEYQLLKDQIAADAQANSVLSDEILEALERMDELQVAIKQAEENLGKTKEELQRVHKRIDDQQQGLETQLARATQELQEAEEQLPENFKPEYLRLARSMGEDALAPVEGGCCGGCFQTLTPQTIDQLLLDRTIFCKSCGRLLYVPEQ